MSDEEWGPWIEHDGRGCPCVGEMVHVVVRSEDGRDPKSGGWKGAYTELNPWEAIGVAENGGSWCWNHGWHPVDRYRIRKPKGLKILEELLVDLPNDIKAPETPQEMVK